MKGLFKSQTTWTALAGILVAVGGVYTGHASLAQAFQVIMTSILGVSIHSGISSQVSNANINAQE